MVFRSKRERRLWFAAGLCTLLIYSTLYVARPATEFLRQQNLLRLLVLLAFLTVAALVVWRLWAEGAGRRVMMTAAAVGLFYVGLLTLVPMMPEERLHFLEYGVVAALIYLALCERRARAAEADPTSRDPLVRLPPAVVAVILTAILGWIDEAIQAVLPNRYYDLRDVAFNSAAAVICLLSVKALEWARQREVE